MSYTTGLSFAEEMIGPLAAIVTTVFYLLTLYLLVLPITPENLLASIYSESLIKTPHQHLLLLVGFDTLIYRKYYDTPPILVGHQVWLFPTGSINLGFLLREKLATVLIIPSSWGSQLGGYPARIKD
jgi:hypothetical protein